MIMRMRTQEGLINHDSPEDHMQLSDVQIQKILYTTDLSDTALHAFSYAVKLANCFGATITVLHVMGEKDTLEPYVASFLSEEQLQEIRKRRSNNAREALIGKKRGGDWSSEEASSQFLESIKTNPSQLSFDQDEVLVLRGAPAEKILKISHDHDFDLIVMGTHGHSLVQDVMGNVAGRVTRESTVPVLSVRLPE
jgi:nucleotide-binding universal stress UspA family protein